MSITPADLARHLRPFLDRPKKLRAMIAGLHLDGTLERPRRQAPPPPTGAEIRARMAEVMRQHVSMHASITRPDLHRAGFSDRQIDAHFEGAKRLAGLERMAA